MISPREDFRASANGKSWPDVVDSQQFRGAVQAAMLEYARATSRDNEHGTLKINGAYEFLYVLMHLCDTQKTIITADSLNLKPTK